MNRVHEQCPKVDSGTVLSPKTGSKLGQVHSAPTWPSQRAQAARPCQLRACVRRASCLLPRSPSAPACAVSLRPVPARPTSARAQRPPGPSTGARPLPARAHCPLEPSACASPAPCAPSPCAPPLMPSAPACSPSLYCDTNCLPHTLFTTIHQSVFQDSAHQPSTRSQYNKLYCNRVSSTACLYYNTLDPLHTSSLAIQSTSLAIQSTSLAYPRPLYHNTMPFLQYNWAVTQIIFCTKFIINFFFVSFFFHFQLLEN